MPPKPNRRRQKSSRTRKSSSSEEKGRPFKVPCLTKFEDLKRKFANVIEINWRGLDKKLIAQSQHIRINENVRFNHRSSITNGVTVEDELNITRRDPESRVTNGADSLDEIQFMTPSQTRLRVKRTPKIRTNEVEDSDEESPNKQPTRRQPARPKNTTNGIKGPRSRAQGSRVTDSEKTTRSGKVRQENGRVNGRCIFNGYRIKNADEFIDTKGFVDDGVICFVHELCHRAQIQPLDDPMELVAGSKFKIELEEFQVPKEVEEEAEIECVDMTTED